MGKNNSYLWLIPLLAKRKKKNARPENKEKIPGVVIMASEYSKISYFYAVGASLLQAFALHALIDDEAMRLQSDNFK